VEACTSKSGSEKADEMTVGLRLTDVGLPAGGAIVGTRGDSFAAVSKCTSVEVVDAP
jgi:hypothetical protein